MGFVPQTDWSNALFDKHLAKVKENREAGYSVTHLSKRDIERWGFFPPCGARVQVLEVEIPSEEWIQMWDKKKVCSGDSQEESSQSKEMR